MTRLTIFGAWLCAIAFVLPLSPAHAAFRTYVSVSGNDANSCLLTSPCLSIAHALTVTSSNGIISCLDGNDYSGTVTIDRSVTIDCGGVPGGGAFGPFTISTAGVAVTIRNGTMFVQGNGITFTSGAALFVENVQIYAMLGLAISFAPSSSAQLSVKNTILRENGGSTTGGGIQIAPTSGAIASVTLDGVEMIANTYGMGLSSSGGTVVGVLRHSIISGSKISGLVAAGGGSPTFFTIDGSTIMNNPSFGIQSQGSGVNLQIGGSTITGNGTGVSGPGIVSFKNNQISGNATDGTPIAAVPAGLQ